MVTGALPYYKEAGANDPIYKYLYYQQNQQFWTAWRKYRDPTEEYSSEESSGNLLRDFCECMLLVLWSLFKRLLAMLKYSIDIVFGLTIYRMMRQHTNTVIETKFVFSNEFQNLVQQMLSHDPSLRPTIAEIKQHAWFNDPSVPTT